MWLDGGDGCCPVGEWAVKEVPNWDSFSWSFYSMIECSPLLYSTLLYSTLEYPALYSVLHTWCSLLYLLRTSISIEWYGMTRTTEPWINATANNINLFPTNQRCSDCLLARPTSRYNTASNIIATPVIPLCPRSLRLQNRRFSSLCARSSFFFLSHPLPLPLPIADTLPSSFHLHLV